VTRKEVPHGGKLFQTKKGIPNLCQEIPSIAVKLPNGISYLRKLDKYVILSLHIIGLERADSSPLLRFAKRRRHNDTERS
jgi:hypothetical protein